MAYFLSPKTLKNKLNNMVCIPSCIAVIAGIISRNVVLVSNAPKWIACHDATLL